MQDFLTSLHAAFAGVFPPAAGMPMQVWYAIGILAGCIPIIAYISIVAMVWTLAERKVAGYIQVRYGPNRVGPWGLLQPIADGLKLLGKEDIIPANADKLLFTLAPLMVFLGALLPFVALPFSESFVIASMSAGLIYILAFEAIEVIGILMAGWAPNSKWSLYGGMRLAAQMVAYEIPMSLCILAVVALGGTLNLGEIVSVQGGAWGLGNWFVWPWVSPFTTVAFLLFFVGGLAGTKRAPFDLPEAESELVAGFHTEYTGMRFSFFFLAEYAAMYVVCAVATICFLGGWHGPGRELFASAEGDIAIRALFAQSVQSSGASGWIDLANLKAVLGVFGSYAFWKPVLYQLSGVFYLILKSWGLLFVMVWVRWTLPRIRIDQVLYICLKVLLPFSLLCVLGAAVQMVLADTNLLQWVAGLGSN